MYAVVHNWPWGEENVKQQRMGNSPSNPINQATFRISLSLTLLVPSHQTVLQYVEILNARPDIHGASVVGVVSGGI